MQRETTIRQPNPPKFAALAQRADLPPRVRALLEGLLERAYGYFHVGVLHTLDELDSGLFKLAERSSSNAQQQERFESLRELKLRRADIAPRFLQFTESSLASVRHRAAPVAAEPASRPERSALELVDSSALEEELTLQEIASKSEIRNTQALFTLSHRLGVVAAAPAYTYETLPLGPAQLVAAFRHSLGDLSLGVEHRVLAYRHFDRTVMLPIGAFYKQLTEYFVQQRVLPHLQWHGGRQRSEASPDRSATQSAAADTAKTKPAADELADPADPHGPGAGTSAASGPEISDGELFKTLRRLIGDRRRAQAPGPAASPAAGAATASLGDLQSVLGSLQRAHGPFAEDFSNAYDAERFKQEVVAQLRRASPGGEQPQLAEEDADTLDLVGLLFDYINTNVRDGSSAKTLLHRLHVPVLRVALADKTFFTRRNHPARELLNTIAETSTRWIDEGETDSDLVTKMQVVVDHVSTDFDGDVGVFENLLTDLGQHMKLLARRAEVAERRHIDAAKGRDKLEIAQEAARAAIARVIQNGKPTPTVRILLEQAWTDALALSALREGPNGAEFKRRLGIAIKLARGPAVAGVDADDSVRQELDAGLRQVGLHAEEIGSVIAGVFTKADTPVAEVAKEADRVTEVLKDKVRLGGDEARTGAAAAAKAQPPAKLNPTETAMLERLRTIPFGTWFDFVLNQQGASSRRKLAWFSTVTGRCLFVNQRGARSTDTTLDQLAREMVRGQVRVAMLEEKSIIDRAWSAIMEKLRSRQPDAGDPQAAL